MSTPQRTPPETATGSGPAGSQTVKSHLARFTSGSRVDHRGRGLMGSFA